MKFLAIIQARMSSRRLPGKVLKKINNISILEMIIERLKKLKDIDKIYVATSNQKSDNKIVNFCKKKKINHYRGSLNNVLSRFEYLFLKYKPEYIIRITGDCPFIDYEFLKKIVNFAKKNKVDFFDLEKKTDLIQGIDLKSSKVYKFIFKEAKSIKDKEHVGSFVFKKNIKKFNGVLVKLPKYYFNYNYRITVDEKKDLLTLQNIFKNENRIMDIKIRKLITIFKKNSHLIKNHKIYDSKDNIALEKIPKKIESYHKKLIF